ncbi:MAG: ABC transporter ATP-binding protein [Synergistaceae bacterium]|jgi:ABC-2 type transport system ATP-binding protein|nr:ABC transporter ATP-binding protein [Synergistaceae bacterium]
MKSEPFAFEVRGLRKAFGSLRAVDSLSFGVFPGEIFGFLGPNGAGKTTTIRMLTGLARPTGGHLFFFGEERTADVKAVQHLMGIVPDDDNLYPELTGRANLEFCGALYGMPRKERQERAEMLLERFGLAEAAGRFFATYSKGMRRKLVLAAALMHRPPILFLDEPTTGIDVASARSIRQLLDDLRCEGTTIFLTTHYIEEAQRLCDRIAFIAEGRLVALDATATLLASAREEGAIDFVVEGETLSLREPLGLAFGGVTCRIEGNTVSVRSSEPLRLTPFLNFFRDRGIELREARREKPSLEEVFLRVTGKAPEERAKGGGDRP